MHGNGRVCRVRNEVARVGKGQAQCLNEQVQVRCGVVCVLTQRQMLQDVQCNQCRQSLHPNYKNVKIVFMMLVFP